MSNLNQDWFKRVLSILSKLNNKINSKSEFHFIKVIEYLIRNNRVDEAREKLSLLAYCINKQLEIKHLDPEIVERLANVYHSSAFFDLKLHLNPIDINQSTLNYYSDRVEEFLTKNEKDGFSTWFFEVNEKKEVLRQIVKFDNLPYQSYSYAYYENDKGGLTFQELCNDYISDLKVIDVDEFELFWIERPL